MITLEAYRDLMSLSSALYSINMRGKTLFIIWLWASLVFFTPFILFVDLTIWLIKLIIQMFEKSLKEMERKDRKRKR